MDLEVNTPAWWLNRLVTQASIQNDMVIEYEKWYSGRHPLPYANASDNSLYRKFQVMSQTNLVGRVVDVAASRLAITGVRTGDEELDEQAWDLWQRSAMDSEQEMVFTTALATGIAYISVWPDERGVPTLYPEHPSQVVHIPVPGRPREVAAALKTFYDQLTLMWTAVLYLPDRIYKWNSGSVFDGISNYSNLDVEELPNPFGVIPIIPLRNRPTMTGWYASEMRDAIPIQKRVNQTLLNMMVAQEAVAFPQRWMTGMEIERDGNGQPSRPFKSGPDSLWVAEDPEAKFGQFNESSFDGYLAVLKQDTEAIASVTNTPVFNLSGHMMVPPSAEALSAMESGLIKKIRQKQLIFGEALEHALRYAMMMDGIPEDDLQSMEVIWRDPRVRSDAAVGDYAVKMQAVGVPREAIWAELGATPQMIDEWKGMAMADAFQQLVAQVGQQQAAGQNPDQNPGQEDDEEQPNIPGTPEAEEEEDFDDSVEETQIDGSSAVKTRTSRRKKVGSLPQGGTEPYPGFIMGNSDINSVK